MNANLTAPAGTPATEAREIELMNGKTPCNCSDGCPGLTTRYFSQGHDARMVTRLRNAHLAGEISLQDAFAEITKRGGTERLQIKLDAAVANARKPRKSKKAAKAKVIDTFELGEFTLAAMPICSSTNIVAKVGRWEYRGEILTYQIVEDGKISKGDQVDVFEYANKSGERQQTVSYTRIRVDEDFEAEAPADEEVEVLYSSDAIEAEAAAEFAAREGGLRRVTNSGDPIPADEDTSDIPF